MTPAPPIVIAHRGASGYRPEHTRSAYELAIALGADAVEPDLVASRDGVLVVRHENEISGTTDVAQHPEFEGRRTTKVVDGVESTGWFTEDFTWAELRTLRARERLPLDRPANVEFDDLEPMLRFEELLDLVPPQVTVVAEIKHDAYFLALGIDLVTLIAATGFEGVIESFELGALRRASDLPVRRVFLLEKTGAPADDPSRTYAQLLADLPALAHEVDGISPDKALLLRAGGADLVTRAHDAGLEVYTWTLRPEARFLSEPHRAAGAWRDEFAEVLATGVDGVFADHPDLAIEVRDRA